jgi:hypothetical protein
VQAIDCFEPKSELVHEEPARIAAVPILSVLAILPIDGGYLRF